MPCDVQGGVQQASLVERMVHVSREQAPPSLSYCSAESALELKASEDEHGSREAPPSRRLSGADGRRSRGSLGNSEQAPPSAFGFG